jgi:xanthine dehydrogenase accessory factor
MTLAAFLDHHPDAVAVRLARVRGSAPREEGAGMVVAAAAFHGTIGGGQLEYMVIDAARAMLAQGGARRDLDIPLGPEIDRAPAGSAFVILSHDHALDFLLVAQGLARGDAAYIGMIGSPAKRARLARWCRDHRNGLDIAALTCPIGAAILGDKRSEVIAAGTLAEVMTALAHRATRATICRAAT